MTVDGHATTRQPNSLRRGWRTRWKFRERCHDEDRRGFRIVVEAQPDTVAICHCQIRQRRTGVPLTCNAYFPKSKVRLEGEAQTPQPLLPGLRLDGRLDTRSTSQSVWRCGWVLQRAEFPAPGGERCALGQYCQRAFSIPRAIDRFRARVKCFPTPVLRPALISLLSFSTTSVGVDFGTPTPYHWLAS